MIGNGKLFYTYPYNTEVTISINICFAASGNKIKMKITTKKFMLAEVEIRKRLW